MVTLVYDEMLDGVWGLVNLRNTGLKKVKLVCNIFWIENNNKTC